MLVGVGFFTYYIVYLWLQCFYIPAFVLLILVSSVLFLIYRYYLPNKRLWKHHIIGFTLGCVLGILYSFYLYNTYKPISNIEDLLVKREGVIYSVSSQSAIIQFVKEDKIYRLRLFIKDASLFLQKRQVISFVCYSVNEDQETSFALFERLQGISKTCRGSIDILKGNTHAIDKARLSINSWLKDQFSKFPEGSYAESFLIADTSRVNANEMQIFRNMGLAHLFAASGMHLALLYAIVYIPFSWIRLSLLGEVLGFLVCTIFLILLDFMLPLLRGYLFLMVYLLLKYCDRKTPPLYNFFFVAFLSEILFPLSAFSYSFILSYWITACILVTYKPIQKILHIPNKFLKEHIALSLSAFIGSIFLSYLLFQSVSVISLLYNLFLTPLAGIYLGSELVALFIPWVQFIVSCLDYIFRYSIKIHLWILESHVVGSHALFTQLWLGMLFIMICISVVLFVKKKHWYIFKWFWKITPIFLLLFFIQFTFVKQNTFGVKAFPYGIIVYDHKDVYISGKVPEYAQGSVKNIFKRLWEAPIKNIYADSYTKDFVRQFFALPVETIQDIPNTYSNGVLKIKDYCFIFAKSLKYQKSPADMSMCIKLYLIESKKDIITEEDIQSKIILGEQKLVRIGFLKWNWDSN